MTPALEVTDMHTGGEPVRIITGGYPEIPGETILEKRAYVRDHLDHLRRILMFEPRGHADMYGALIVPPSLPGAHFGVLFMHNEGYSTMCGHAVIALGRYAVDQGWVKPENGHAIVNIECPCGLVRAEVSMAGGKAGAVSFESVPAFLFAEDLVVDVPGWGPVSCEVAYGGAFYALADISAFGLGFGESPVAEIVEAADRLTSAVREAISLEHPDDADLAFLYGSILTDGKKGKGGEPTVNICVFADRQVDRSPTGSGVTARLAAMHAKDMVETGESRLFESITGSRFEGAVVAITRCGNRPAVTVRVSGRAHYAGHARFIVEDDDPLAGGFLVR